MPSGRQPATGARLVAHHLSFDGDTVSESSMKSSLFVKGARAQYLFPSDAVTLKTANRLIVEAYSHIFVFPSDVQMRHLGSMERLRADSFESFYRNASRLDKAAPQQYMMKTERGNGSPAPEPACPDCVAYADARLYKGGALVGTLSLASLSAKNATSITRRVQSGARTTSFYGDPGICGDPGSAWYYDPFCVTDYYLLGGGNQDGSGPAPIDFTIIIPFTTNPFRSPGVTSYTWSDAKQLTTMLANWDGFDYANIYHGFHSYIDITGNFDSKNFDWDASYYGKQMDFETEFSHTFLSRTDVVITSVQTSPNGTQTSTQEPARYAIVATPI